MKNSIRALCVFAVVICLMALLLMPGATTAVVVRSHATGKQSVRVISVLTLLAFAAAVSNGLLRLSSQWLHGLRQVSTHGYGPCLLDKTCARLC